MPAFQKIGGLMTSCMAGDTAALHAATIAINQSLSSYASARVLESLQNVAARLQNVVPEHAAYYHEALKEAKEMKTQAALNRSLNDSYVPDAYDELLTPAEIQGHINNVNAKYALQNIIKCLDLSQQKFLAAISTPSLQIQNIFSENAKFYKEELAILRSGLEEEYTENYRHCQEFIQERINVANEIAEKTNNRQIVVNLLNDALEHNCYETFIEALTSANLGLNDYVDTFALPLYYSEMRIDRLESKNDLSYSDIVVSIRVLSAIAYITKTVDTGDPELIYEALSDPEAHITELDAENKVKYYRALMEVRSEKKFSNEACTLLNYIDIQECIDEVNQQCSKDNEILIALEQLNRSVLTNNRKDLIDALTNKAFKLQTPVSPGDASLYLKMFRMCLNEKNEIGSELWLQDVENVAQFVASEAERVQTACSLLSNINTALRNNDAKSTLKHLEDAGIGILEGHRSEYFTRLKYMSDYKQQHFQYPYVRYVTPEGNESFLNLKNCSYSWDSPRNLTEESVYITKEDIENIIKEIEMEESDREDAAFDEQLIIKLQAIARGFLLRQKIAARFTHFYDNIEKIVQIQAWWRGVLTRKIYAKILQTRSRRQPAQDFDHKRTKNKHQNTFDFYRQHEDKIIKIQAVWRGRTARRAFHSLLRLEKPPFPVVRHFSAILNFNAEDYDKDLQLQQLKNDVVQTIRHNQKLSQQLDEMDIKIGLLIQNRITLQVSENLLTGIK